MKNMTKQRFNMSLHNAIKFAAIKHDNQKRKGTDIPYITHPMEVMQILTENNYEKEVIIAGILHDILEDTATTPNEIHELFGNRVLEIVQAESEDKSKSWKERKQTTIEQLSGVSIEIKLVCCADKLSNLRSITSDLETIGEKLWERFNAGKDDICWYYSGIVAALTELKDYSMHKELVLLNDSLLSTCL